MRISRKQILLYPIVNVASVDDPLDQITKLCLANVSVIQLRDKRELCDEKSKLAVAFVDTCRKHNVLSIMNDDAETANSLGADGVHVGPHDRSARDIRKSFPNLIIGGSAGSVTDALRLVDEGVDYLGVGAIFDASVSKPNASRPRGIKILIDVLEAVDIPIVGIGGIDFTNFESVLKTGAGIAVIRALIQSPEPNVKKFWETISKYEDV